MKTSPVLSINQFAEFANATAAGKKRIIKQQLVPDKFLVPWYQAARAAMKRYLKDVNNSTAIDKAIQLLIEKKPETKRQETDRRVSIEALMQLKEFAFPKLFRNLDFEIIKPDQKNLEINNISIIVAPDVILKSTYKGRQVYGAVKIHICKTKPFDQNQSRHVANLLQKYLQKKVVEDGDEILPELCFCVDIFAGRIASASDSTKADDILIKHICKELSDLWAA